MDHDHSHATHSMNCPVEGCEFKLEVHAHDEDGAVDEAMKLGKEHFEEAHPDEDGMSKEEMEETTRKLLKKL